MPTGKWSTSPDPEGGAKHIACLFVAALIRVDLPQVVDLGGRTDHVTSFHAGSTAPVPVVERQVPMPLVVGTHAEVVEDVGLADQIAELLIHGQGFRSGRLAGRVVEVGVGGDEQVEGVCFRLGIRGALEFPEGTFAPLDTCCVSALPESYPGVVDEEVGRASRSASISSSLSPRLNHLRAWERFPFRS